MGEKETASAEELEQRQHGAVGLQTDPSAAAGASSGPRKAQQGFRSGEGATADLDGDGAPEAAINNTKSNIKSGPGHAAGGGAAGDEAALLKNKTKSNQSNDRSAQEAELIPGDEAALVKPKTKSNQSNDRLDQGDTGTLDPDSDDDGIDDGSARRTDVTEQATWTTSNPGIKAGSAASDASAGKVSMQDMHLAQSAIKSGPRQTAGREGMPADPQPLDVDDDGDSLAESKWYNVKTNEKGRLAGDGGSTGEDDWEQPAAKLAPERPVKSEIAIGDPGVNGNLEVDDDDGGGQAGDASLRNPRSGYDIKTNTK